MLTFGDKNDLERVIESMPDYQGFEVDGHECNCEYCEYGNVSESSLDDVKGVTCLSCSSIISTQKGLPSKCRYCGTKFYDNRSLKEYMRNKYLL